MAQNKSSAKTSLARPRREAGAKPAVGPRRKSAAAPVAAAGYEYRIFFEESPSGTMIQAADWRALQVNQALLDLLGYDKQELLDLPSLASLFHPDEHERIGSCHAALEQGMERIHLRDIRMLRKDRELVWADVSTRRLSDCRGVAAYMTIFEDITGRKRQERHLDSVMLEQQLMLESMSIGILYSKNRMIMHCNTCIEAMFGYAPDELVAKNARILYHSDEDFAAAGERFADLNNPLKPVEKSYRAKDGSAIWCYVSARRIDPTDPAKGLVAAFVDITERKRQERDLASSLREQELLFNSTVVGLAYTRKGNVVRANYTLEKILGYGPGEAVGKSTRLLFDSEVEWLSVAGSMQEAIREKGESHIELPLRRKDGVKVWCELHARPINPGSVGEGTVHAVVDVTERHEQRKRLEQAVVEQQLIFDTALVGLSISKDLLWVKVNRMAAETFGYEPDELIGTSTRVIYISDEDWRDAQETMRRMIIEQGFTHIERQFVRKDGSHVWCEIYGRPLVPQRPEQGIIFATQDITLRKHQQAELDAALRQQELLFDLAVVGLIYARNRRFVKVNKKLLDMFGYRGEEIIGESTRLLHPTEELWDERTDKIFAAVPGNEILQEGEFVRKGGTRVWCQFAGRPVNMADHSQGIIVAVIDIDQRKRAEEELMKAQHFLGLIIESMPVLVSVKDAKSLKFLRVNRAAEKITGWPRDQVIGKTHFDIHPEPQARLYHERDMASLSDHGPVKTYEEELVTPAGDKRIIRTRTLPVREADGNVPYILTIAEDVTEQVRAGTALRDSEVQFRQLTDIIDQFVFVIDPDRGRTYYLNERYEEVWGGDSKEFLADPASRRKYIHPDDLQQVLERGESQGSEQSTDQEFRILHPRKGLRWVRLRTQPARLHDGVVRTLGIAEDVTRRKQDEQARLDQAVKQRDLLVREVHHRIKNHLQGVAGLLQHSASEHPEASDVLQGVANQVQAIAQVHGLQVREGNRLPFQAMLLAIFRNLQAFASEDLAVNSNESDLIAASLAESESVPIALIINELVTNAIKHRAGGQKGLRAWARLQGAEVVLTIENPGQIPPGFDFDGISGGIAGLGLVKALLPQRGARLSYRQAGAIVEVTLALSAPVIEIDPVAAVSG